MARGKGEYSDKTLYKRLNKYKPQPNPILLKEYALISSDGETMKMFDTIKDTATYLRISDSKCRGLVKSGKDINGIRIIKLD